MPRLILGLALCAAGECWLAPPAPRRALAPARRSVSAGSAAAAEASRRETLEDWALQDAVSKYSVAGGRVVLWRRMVDEVPELAGRDADEVRRRWLQRLSRAPDGGAAGEGAAAPAALLAPLLDAWREGADGAFEGQLYGQPGIADGQLSRTAPVPAARRRVDDGWIEPAAGVVYELGAPAGLAPLAARAPGDELADGVGATLGAALGAPAAAAAELAPRKGASWPAILLSGAAAGGLASAAVGVLGHHLSVHVFWV